MKTSRIARTALLLVPLAAAVMWAQPGEPAKELARFDVFLGNWKGSGTVRPAPGAEEGRWTATVGVRRILDGHFVQQDVRVEGAAPTAMLFRAVFFWDRAAERFRFFSMGNIAGGDADVLFWPDERTMTGSRTMRVEGGVATDRWVYRFSKDRYEIRVDRALDGGEFFVHLAGVMERGGDGCSIEKETSSPPLKEPSQRLQPFHGLLGRWRFTGSAVPLPGMEPVAVAGREEVSLLLGGHVLMTVVEGDAAPDRPPFKGFGYLVWDEGERSLTHFALNSAGHAAVTRARVEGERRLVFTGAPPAPGAPLEVRGVVELSADGNEMKAWTERLGDQGLERSFSATARRVTKEQGP